jgi:hypothetical protein
MKTIESRIAALRFSQLCPVLNKQILTSFNITGCVKALTPKCSFHLEGLSETKWTLGYEVLLTGSQTGITRTQVVCRPVEVSWFLSLFVIRDAVI